MSRMSFKTLIVSSFFLYLKYLGNCDGTFAKVRREKPEMRIKKKPEKFL